MSLKTRKIEKDLLNKEFIKENKQINIIYIID